MYAKSDSGKNGEHSKNSPVVVIKGKNDDSFDLGDDVETDTLYLLRTATGVAVYYMDIDEDFSTGKPVPHMDISSTTLAEAVAAVTAAEAALVVVEDAAGNASVDVTAAEAEVTAAQGVLDTANIAVTAAQIALADAEAAATVAAFEGTIATLIAEDTDLEVRITGNENITLTIGNIEISLGEDTNGFIMLGTEEEEAESNDVVVDGKAIGTKENDVMDYYGIIIENPEDNSDEDKVVLKIPSEQVYAKISVLGSEEDSNVVTANKPTPAELNITKITDGQISTALDKNLIVVGGSCVNTLAAELLGGAFCGAEFTTNTGVGPGQVLIQTFDRGNGNIATLVAGYDAADTVRGVEYLKNNNLNIAVGDKIIV